MPKENNLFIDNIELLQAINDWQINSTKKRGEKLKNVCSNLPIKYRESNLICYRKIDLTKEFIWDLIAENLLAEKVSSWTTDINIAKSFKNGVPLQDGEYKGVILAIKPTLNCTIVNLEELYRSEDFQYSLKINKNRIKNFNLGCEKYSSSQKEIVMEITSVTSQEIYSLGGYSSLIIPGIIEKPLPAWTTYESTQNILHRLYSGEYKNDYPN